MINARTLYGIAIVAAILFILQSAYSQQAGYSSNGDTMYISGYSVLRNLNGYIPNTFDTGYTSFPGLIAHWGNEIPVSNTANTHYFSPALAVGDSILHAFGNNSVPGPPSAHHYISLDRGMNWTFFANYYDPTMNIDPGIIRAYCEGPRLCTVWWGRHGTENGFVYFRASTDKGNTWPITADIRNNPYTWRDARDGNIAGHGDTVFVSFRQDSLSCWHSTDLGRHWQDPGYFAGGPSHAGMVPWITYKAGIISIIYEDTYHFDEQISTNDIFYVRSLDKGITWDSAQFLGFSDYYHGQWPEMAADDYGNIATCWMDYVGSPYGWTGGIWCKISHDTGRTWQPAVRLDSTYLGSVWTTVAIDGDYVSVVWTEESPNNYLVYRESRDGGVTWRQREYLIHGENAVPDMIKWRNDLHLLWLRDNQNIRYMQNSRITSVSESDQTGLPTKPGLSAYPNPFNSTIIFNLENYKGGESDLIIYDILGRVVTSVRFDNVGRTSWDGTNAIGKSIPSGIYFAKSSSPFGKISKNILYLK
jgi:hypothetical protein